MSNVHTQTIPLYNKGALSATGYRIGSGYNVKLNYGTIELASKPSLYDCILHSYIGIRLKSPKFHDWLTEELREQILRELGEMDTLIDGRITSYRNEGLKEILSKGMKWEINNTLQINIDQADLQPEERIREVRDMFFNDFLKATKLVVHIRMTSPFKDKADLFEVSLFEDKQHDKPYMSVMESNLPSSLFNREWIDNAKNSFNAYRRASAPVQLGINPAVYHPLAPLHPGIQDPVQQPGLGISPYTNKPFTYGTGTPAQFKLYGETGDIDVTLNGSTVSFQASGDVSARAPQINVTGGMNCFAPKLNLGELASPHVTAFGKSVFDMDDRLVAQVDIRSVKAYNESPYFNQEVQMPIPFQEFIETKLKWSWMDTTFEDYLLKGYKSDDQGRDPQVVAFINIASRLCNVLIA